MARLVAVERLLSNRIDPREPLHAGHAVDRDEPASMAVSAARTVALTVTWCASASQGEELVEPRLTRTPAPLPPSMPRSRPVDERFDPRVPNYHVLRHRGDAGRLARARSTTAWRRTGWLNISWMASVPGALPDRHGDLDCGRGGRPGRGERDRRSTRPPTSTARSASPSTYGISKSSRMVKPNRMTSQRRASTNQSMVRRTNWKALEADLGRVPEDVNGAGLNRSNHRADERFEPISASLARRHGGSS